MSRELLPRSPQGDTALPRPSRSITTAVKATVRPASISGTPVGRDASPLVALPSGEATSVLKRDGRRRTPIAAPRSPFVFLGSLPAPFTPTQRVHRVLPCERVSSRRANGESSIRRGGGPSPHGNRASLWSGAAQRGVCAGENDGRPSRTEPPDAPHERRRCQLPVGGGVAPLQRQRPATENGPHDGGVYPLRVFKTRPQSRR